MEYSHFNFATLFLLLIWEVHFNKSLFVQIILIFICLLSTWSFSLDQLSLNLYSQILSSYSHVKCLYLFRGFIPLLWDKGQPLSRFMLLRRLLAFQLKTRVFLVKKGYVLYTYVYVYTYICMYIHKHMYIYVYIYILTIHL